jgi:UDP-glucose 4-epimerase
MDYRILISGGVGYIGSVLSNALFDKKISFAIIDNLSNSKKNFINKNFLLYKANINNLLVLNKIYKEFNPTHIIHLAASIDVNESEINKIKYFRNNVSNSKKFINFFISKNVKNFLFASSAAVYNNSCNKKKESLKEIPANYYGQTKLFIEKFLLEKKKNNNLNVKIFRFFNVVGADKKKRSGNNLFNNNSLFNNLCAAFFFNKKFIINGINYNTNDGTCIRDFIDVNDLVKIVIFFINKKIKNSIFNIGNNKGYSILEIIKIFNKTLKKNIKYKFASNRPADVPYSVCNNAILRKHYKFKFTDIKKTIKLHYSYFCKINYSYLFN